MRYVPDATELAFMTSFSGCIKFGREGGTVGKILFNLFFIDPVPPRQVHPNVLPLNLFVIVMSRTLVSAAWRVMIAATMSETIFVEVRWDRTSWLPLFWSGHWRRSSTRATTIRLQGINRCTKLLNFGCLGCMES